MRNLIVLLIAGVIILSWAMVLSHTPLFEASRTDTYELAQSIPDAQKPWAIFGEIERLHEVDHYTFIAKDEIALKLQLLVPKKDGPGSFHPLIVLIGPGIHGKSSIIGELPPVSGAMDIVPSEDDYKKTVMDWFTFITYWKGPTREVDIPEEGRYYLVVVPNGNETGDYVLRVGEEKNISLMNVLGAFFSWFRIQWMHWS